MSLTESPNPYAVPQSASNLDAELVPSALVPADKGARLANLVIDYFVHLGIGFGVPVLLVVAWGEEAVERLGGVPAALITWPAMLGYYWIAEATTGRTLGKLVTGTKVVNAAGGKPTLGQITGRTFARLIPLEAFSFLGDPPRGWHDSLSGTSVVRIGDGRFAESDVPTAYDVDAARRETADKPRVSTAYCSICDAEVTIDADDRCLQCRWPV